MKIRMGTLPMFLALAPLACTDLNEASLGSTSQQIVDVEQTAVERQSIGNCWLYAHASWAESLHKRATGEDFDISQSYWTYMHCFDQITQGQVRDDELATGGSWSRRRRGFV